MAGNGNFLTFFGAGKVTKSQRICVAPTTVCVDGFFIMKWP